MPVWMVVKTIFNKYSLIVVAITGLVGTLMWSGISVKKVKAQLKIEEELGNHSIS